MVKTTRCIRFPRLARLEAAPKTLDESVDLGQFGGPFSAEELAELAFGCGETDRLQDGGWILPDGAVLDFRRSDASNNAVRHSRIYDFLSPARRKALEKLMTPHDLRWSDDSIAIDMCMAGGFIRYHLSERGGECLFYMSAERKPTLRQLGVLRDIEELVGRTQCPRFTGIFECNGSHLRYDDPREFSTRFVNDVVRCF